jgi:HPt (histidine-containing phosphotransfer) domain-containing protein
MKMHHLEWDRDFALEQAGDDEEMLAELLLLFRDSAADDLTRMREALVRKGGAALADAAHSIKGASASLGVEGISKLAAEIEKAGRQGELVRAGAMLADLAELLLHVDSLR